MQKYIEKNSADSRTKIITWSKQEIEECVTLIRLHLYNRNLPCGPKEIQRKMEDEYGVKSAPSERTISRILARQGLTHQRTGWYPGEARNG